MKQVHEADSWSERGRSGVRDVASIEEEIWSKLGATRADPRVPMLLQLHIHRFL